MGHEENSIVYLPTIAQSYFKELLKIDVSGTSMQAYNLSMNAKLWRFLVTMHDFFAGVFFPKYKYNFFPKYYHKHQATDKKNCYFITVSCKQAFFWKVICIEQGVFFGTGNLFS